MAGEQSEIRERYRLHHAALHVAVVARSADSPLVFLSAGGLFMLLQLQAMAVAITLVLLHFYLDGVFWAFRRPEVRKALGPYLIGWHNPGTQAPGGPSRVGANPSG